MTAAAKYKIRNLSNLGCLIASPTTAQSEFGLFWCDLDITLYFQLTTKNCFENTSVVHVLRIEYSRTKSIVTFYFVFQF